MFTKEQVREFERICKPIFEFLAKNCDPHQSVIIDNDYARIVSDNIGIPNKLSE